MAVKADIQATRTDAAAGASAVIAPPVRLKGIIIASDGTGAGTLELTTTSNSGTTLFQADIPSGDVIILIFLKMEFYFLQEFFVKLKLKLLHIHY